MAKTAVKTRKSAEAVKTKATVVVKIAIRDMVDRLLKVQNTTFVQIWQTTEPSMKKTGNRFVDKVIKKNCLNCLIGYQYAKMVNNAREKENKEIKVEDKKIRLEENREQLIDAMILAGVPRYKAMAFFADMEKSVDEDATEFVSTGLKWGEYMTDPVTGEKSRCIIEHTPGSGRWKDIHGYYIQAAIMHSSEPVYRWKESGKMLTESEIEEMKTFFPKKKEGTRQGLAKPYIIRSPRLDTFDSFTLFGINYQF